MSNVAVISLVNAGSLITDGHHAILIDALSAPGGHPFSSPDPQLLDAMLDAGFPLASVCRASLGREVAPLSLDAYLFTHAHRDHCSLSALKSIQNKTIPIIVPYTEGRIESASDFENPVILIGGDATAEQAVGSRKGSESLDQSAGRAEGSGAEQVTGQRKASELLDQPAGRAEGSEPAEQIIELPGVTIRAIRTAHDGGEKYQIAHYSYLVEIGGVTVFVMGDASPTDENLIRAASETRVDIAGLNYVEIHREAGRKLIKNALRPSKLLLWHIPLERDDVWNQRKSVHKDMARYGAELPETAAAFECFTEIRFSNARR